MFVRRLVQVCLTIIVAAVAVPAAAQDGSFYGSVFGGVSFARDSDIAVRVPGPQRISGEMEFDTGWLAGVAGGYGWANGFAVEGEYSFTRNGLDQEHLNNIGTIGVDGEIDTQAVMINGYYRFDTGTGFTPYIGAGAGVGFMKVSALADGNTTRFRANDTQFAYQAIAGLSYAFTSNVRLGVEYRFFGVTEPTFSDNPDGNGSVSTDIKRQNQNVLMKLSYSFN